MEDPESDAPLLVAPPKPLLQKPDLKLRWPMLVFISLALFGDFYVYDMPSALKTEIKNHFADQISDSQYETRFALLYSIYSFPNIVLPFFGGFLVDRFGTRRTFMAYASIYTAGQALVAFGISIKNFWVVLMGRFVFAVGGESITVAQSAILTEWFRGKELALSFGISLSVSRAGSVLTNYLSPAAAQHGGLAWSFWLGTLLCAGSLATVWMLVPLDLRAEKLIARDAQSRSGADGGGADGGGTDGGGADGSEQTEAEVGEETGKAKADASGDSDADHPGLLSTAKHFKPIFWYVCCSAVAIYGVVMPWNNTSSALLLERDFFKPRRASPVDAASVDAGAAPCCCWNFSDANRHIVSDSNCFEYWPKAGIAPRDDYSAANMSAFAVRIGPTWGNSSAVVMARSCHESCAEDLVDTSIAPPINLTKDQHLHLDCLANASDNYGLNKRAWGFDSPPLPAVQVSGDGDGNNEALPWLQHYCDRYNAAVLRTGIMMSIPYYTNVATSPLLGYLVDKYARCADICCIAPALMLVAHMFLGALPSMPCTGALVLQGVAYSFYAAAVWPPVVYIVESWQVGTAYGLMTSLMNLGFTVFPLVAAAIYDANGEKYIPAVEYFYSALAAIGLIFGLLLLREDRKMGQPFNKPHLTQDDDSGKQDHDTEQ